MAIDNSRIISTVKILLAKGIDGVGIESIEKTGTSGLVDTYTITYTDSRKTTFTITNGNGIASVEKTNTSGLVDTYTITFDDGSTETFDITNGRGITKIEKTATVGNVDTYTITYNDGTTSTYEVTNGAGSTASGIIFTDNGEGATNVQDAVDNTLKLIAPIQLTLTADKTYNVGDQFVYEGLLYEVTATIASGTAITIGSNCQLTDTVAEQLSEINSNISKIYTIDIGTHATSDGNPYLYVFNNKVAILVLHGIKNLSSNYQKIGELPINIRPSTYAYSNAYNETSHQTNCRIQANGDIEMMVTSGSTSYPTITMIFQIS